MAAAQVSTLPRMVSPAAASYVKVIASFPATREVYAWEEGEVQHLLSTIATNDPEAEYTLYGIQGEVIENYPNERLLFHTIDLERRDPDSAIEDMLGPQAIAIFERAE